MHTYNFYEDMTAIRISIKQLKEELANLKDLWDRNLASWDDEVRMDQCLLSINELELELCKLYEQQGVTRRFDYASIYAT